MSERTVPRDLALSRRLGELSDELKWNLSEQYIADREHVLKGGNEIVSLYVRQTPDEAAALADGMERLVGPLRRRKVLELLDNIDTLSAEIRAEQHKTE